MYSCGSNAPISGCKICISCDNKSKFEEFLLTRQEPISNVKTIESRLSIDSGMIPDLDGKVSLIHSWYKHDVGWLLNQINILENKNIQLKHKLDVGPCGKCRKDSAE